MTNRKVVYLLSGQAHLAYALVSLRSLRRHYDGEIEVYAWPESIGIAGQIAGDDRIRARAVARDTNYRGKNCQFLAKIKLMQEIDAESAIYLDADTLIQGSLNYLFELTDQYGFVVTQFNDWKSNCGVIHKRVSRLINRQGIDQESVRTVLDNPLPSVNGGVFACRPKCSVLEIWHELSMKVKDLFICDETILHMLVGLYNDIGGTPFTVAGGGKWNASPKYKPANLDDSDVVIWHFHGDSNVRPQKSGKGFAIWWPEFKSCLEDNVGGVQDWISTIGNKYIFQLMKEEQ